MTPKVSIITPVYNGAGYLPDAWRSLQGQTLSDWEWIVINDGSTDGTAEFLNGLVDPRVRVLHQLNAGVSVARNAGLAVAQGDYVTFLDADDALPPDSLARRAGYLDEHPDVTVVDGRIRIMDATLQTVVREREPGLCGPFFSRVIRLEPSVFFGVVVMLRRAALGEARFMPGLTHCEDLLFLLQASDGQGWRYGAVDAPVYTYRTGNTSAMSNLAGIERGYLTVLAAAQRFSEATSDDREYLRRRIRRILFRSWLRRGNVMKALRAGFTLTMKWRNA